MTLRRPTTRLPVEELLRRARTLPSHEVMVIDDLGEDEAPPSWSPSRPGGRGSAMAQRSRERREAGSPTLAHRPGRRRRRPALVGSQLGRCSTASNAWMSLAESVCLPSAATNDTRKESSRSVARPAYRALIHMATANTSAALPIAMIGPARVVSPAAAMPTVAAHVRTTTQPAHRSQKLLSRTLAQRSGRRCIEPQAATKPEVSTSIAIATTTTSDTRRYLGSSGARSHRGLRPDRTSLNKTNEITTTKAPRPTDHQ